MAISLDEMNKITLDFYYRNSDSILAMLQVAAEWDDKEMFDDVIAECKKRNIDVGKLIRDDIARHEALWGKINRKVT